MEDNFAIQLFEGKKVRIVWDEEQEKYYFSVVDIVQVLIGSSDYQQARKYWKVLKGRLIKEGNESVTNCHRLKFHGIDNIRRFRKISAIIFLRPFVWARLFFCKKSCICQKKAVPLRRICIAEYTKPYYICILGYTKLRYF